MKLTKEQKQIEKLTSLSYNKVKQLVTQKEYGLFLNYVYWLAHPMKEQTFTDWCQEHGANMFRVAQWGSIAGYYAQVLYSKDKQLQSLRVRQKLLEQIEKGNVRAIEAWLKLIEGQAEKQEVQISTEAAYRLAQQALKEIEAQHAHKEKE